MNSSVEAVQMLLVFGWMPLVFVVAGIAIIVSNRSRDRQRTAQAVGTIVGIREKRSTRRGMHGGRSHMVTFHPVIRFMDGSGNVWEVVSPVGRDKYLQAVGKVVSVSYDPADPMRTAVVSEDGQSGSLIGGAFIAFGALILIVLLAVVLWASYNK